jgi:Heterokaryon incompatibility protein (HET)
VEADGGSAISLDRAAAWVQNCVKNHERCGAQSVPLPSRVLDLEAGTNPRYIKLWETEGVHGHYVALSHCWGRVAHFTTTSASMAARKRGLQIEELPKTFQDAVKIARRFGIRYLWIDSLCICQDDVDDWAHESANMAAIYSNAHLTIAAAHASDSSAGCFNQRPTRRHLPITITAKDGATRQLLAFLLSAKDEEFSTLDRLRREPLHERAWAMQERLMARRVLLYCTDEMSFECTEEVISENGVRSFERHCNLFQEPGMAYAQMSRHSANHGLWYYLLADYGARKLSEPSDKLPAISGLARLFESRIEASYVAGLWSDALVEGLAWRGLRPLGWETPGAQTYNAPSWSWASYHGCTFAATLGQTTWKEIASVLDYHIELKTQNPYGEVKSGWIRIEAPLVPLSPEDEPEHGYLRMKIAGDDSHCYFGHWDSIDAGYDAERKFVDSLDHFALVLGRGRQINGERGEKGEADQQKEKNEEAGGTEEGDGEAEDEDRNAAEFDDCYWSLLVVATNNGAQMRRVGSITIITEFSKGRERFEDRSKFKTIMLV